MTEPTEAELDALEQACREVRAVLDALEQACAEATPDSEFVVLARAHLPSLLAAYKVRGERIVELEAEVAAERAERIAELEAITGDAAKRRRLADGDKPLPQVEDIKGLYIQ